jgi:hypothetical protein
MLVLARTEPRLAAFPSFTLEAAFCGTRNADTAKEIRGEHGEWRVYIRAVVETHLETRGIHVVFVPVGVFLLVLDVLGVLQVRFEPVLRQYSQLDASRGHQQHCGEDEETAAYTCKSWRQLKHVQFTTKSGAHRKR